MRAVSWRRCLISLVVCCLAALSLRADAQLLDYGPLELVDEVTDVIDTIELDIDAAEEITSELDLTEPLAAVQESLLNTELTIGERLAVSNDKGKALFHEVVLDDGARVIEGEWLLLLREHDAQLLQLKAFSHLNILERTSLSILKQEIVRIKAPASKKQQAALAKLLATYNITFDQHHVFDVQSQTPTKAEPHLPSPSASSDILPAIKLGLIDTAVQQNHPSLQASAIYQHSFITPNMRAPIAHGTAVASLWVGNGQHVRGVLPKAQVFAASVFYLRDDGGQSAPALHLIKALEWLMAQQVPVINMSLAGPANAVLEQAIKSASANGVIIVAAAGNAGPASKPLFPAAWPAVVAVTAINQDADIYRWAVQGAHIDFAALGVNVMAAKADGGEGLESGTSMASPKVAAHIAKHLAQQPQLTPAEVIRALAVSARDLGAPGKDPVFGFGALGQ